MIFDENGIIEYRNGGSANADLWYSKGDGKWNGLVYNIKTIRNGYVLFYTQYGGDKPRSKDNDSIEYRHISASESINYVSKIANKSSNYSLQFIYFFARDLAHYYNIKDKDLNQKIEDMRIRLGW